MVHHIDTFPDREIQIDDQTYLYFGGTSYLGLQTDTEFQQLFIKNVKQYGPNYGASRKSNVRLSIFEKAERYLAEWVGSEACISMSSGYLAAQLVVQSLLLEGHTLFPTPRTHSALTLPGLEPYPTYAELANALRNHLAQKSSSAPVVLLDSIDFSGSNYPDFNELLALPLEKIILVVDDSHGIGVVGEDGRGVYPMTNTWGTKELIVCCSLGKGLGIQGGAIFGRSMRTGRLVNTAFYGSASPAAPAAMATLLEAQKIYTKKRTVLRDRITMFLNTLERPEKFIAIADHPAFGFSDTHLAEFLMKNGVVVTNFSYPNEDVFTTGRIVLSAAHRKTDVEYLLKNLNDYLG